MIEKIIEQSDNFLILQDLKNKSKKKITERKNKRNGYTERNENEGERKNDWKKLRRHKGAGINPERLVKER